MYSALDIARYVVNYSNSKDYGITNLKLQKVLYFIQAWFLMKKEERCFRNEIIAWELGPVIPEVYHEFKRFGSSYIPNVKSFLSIDNDDIWSMKRVAFTDDVINDSDKEIINKIVDDLSEFSATYLVKVTHKQKPWIDAYAKGKNTIISEESMRNYFCNGH